GGGLGWINLAVTIVDASGTSIVPSGAGWNVTALGIVGGPVAYFQLDSLTHTWTTQETAAVTSQEALLVTSPPAIPLGGQGDSLDVEGTGSFAGSISIPIP
ncbi:MAG: hypothetical protein L3K06_03480, partial [Thermoplasmata archaeon]|nr:hypothetical protein [Thermoplasmata archaeon]